MAIVRVNAANDGALCAVNGAQCWRTAVKDVAEAIAPSAPITILLHGYRYSWSTPSRAGRCDPQQTLYYAPRRTEFADDFMRHAAAEQAAAWPGALGFSHDDTAGLCIPFGWDARKAGLSGFAHIHRNAAKVASGLIQLIDHLAHIVPGRPVDIFAHSLGARLILQALTLRPDLPMGRIILLAPAERQSTALRALDRLEAAGSSAQFLHVLARANDAFDGIYELLAPASKTKGDAPLGAAGICNAGDHWLDLQIDHPDARLWLARLGLRPAPSVSRISHWVVYTDPAVMTLYRRMLHNRADWSNAELLRRGIPVCITPRWSRLRPALPTFARRGHGGQSDTAALPV